MTQDVKQVLREILTIIDYQDDKETYINVFLQMCMQQALIDVVTMLSVEQQDELKQKLLTEKDREKQKAIVVAYVTPEQYSEALTKVSQTEFSSLLQIIFRDLADPQKEKLQTYLVQSHQR